MFSLFLSVVLLAALPGPSPVALPLMPSASVATTQPTSTTTVEQTDVDESSVAQIFGNTRIGELFRGKKKVTIDDVRDPAFWIDTVRDLILAVLTFIPRIVVAGMFLVFFWAIYRAVRRVV